ncbi:uncharacterized protein KY384_002300 [Bacidia gigantensis]|uniref:uncharacterized protein n=1 Tax=Bacidia gigantensis TaxID=2732470 RepID=UPI001D05224D|nr:uncharacterized protein KY384_002300 [Bacidia gigantensis]KAG8533514.1 hypothetical protein KY384_002300 [Bacidia gigantensis]
MSDRNANQGMRDMNAPTPEQSIPPQQQRSQDRNAQDRSQPSSPGAPKAMNNQRQGGGRSSGSQAGMARKTKALGGKGGKKGTGTATATLSSEILLSTLVQQKPMPRVTGKKPGEAKVMFEGGCGEGGGLEGHMGEMLGHGRGLVKMIV